MKRILALLLSVTFLFVMLAACGGDTGDDTGTPTPGGSQITGGESGDGEEWDGIPRLPSDYENIELPDKEADVYREKDGKRHIIIGSHYDIFNDGLYDSTFADIYDHDVTPSDPYKAQLAFDKLKYVEEKYNVYIEFVNLTWDGIMENIPISIMSGWPDCDVYLCDLQYGVPAVLNNMATPLEDMAITSEFYDDLFGDNIIMENLMVPGMEKTYLFKPATLSWHLYMLGYNRDMVALAGLEDPQDLWDKGEWTWDKFLEYCVELTDSSAGVYGYGGFWTNFLTMMLFSNNAAFASGPQEGLSSNETLEVLDFFDQLYNVRGAAAPWNPDDWDINNNIYREGKLGFWISAPWINQQFLDVVGGAGNLPFDIGMVPAPVGPSGNKDTNAMRNATGGNFYMIPRYIKDPGQVFDVMYELTNWFDGDLTERDDMDEFANVMISQRNLDLYLSLVGRVGFELYEVLGVSGAGLPIMLEQTTQGPEYSPIVYSETFRQNYQEALDKYFG